MLNIGRVYKHPKQGLIYIERGQYMGTYGISNFWYWRQVESDGTLGAVSRGYGGNWPEVNVDIEIKIKVK